MKIVLDHRTMPSMCFNAFCVDSKNRSKINNNLFSGPFEQYHPDKEKLYGFLIDGIDRELLKNLMCYKIVSVNSKVESVKSALNELKQEDSFYHNGKLDRSRIEKYLTFTGVEFVDNSNASDMENLRFMLAAGINSDAMRHCLPMRLKTKIRIDINMRILQRFARINSDEPVVALSKAMLGKL